MFPRGKMRKKRKDDEMRKLLFVFVILLAMTSCGNSSEKEFAELVAQAEEHYNSDDYASAATVYEKALTLKEDAAVRTTSTKLDAEIEQIKIAAEMHRQLKDLGSKHEGVLSSLALITMCNDLTEEFTLIENIETSGNFGADRYIEKFRESSDFFLAKSKAGLLSVTHSAGIAENDAFTDALELHDRVDALLTKFPLPNGYSTVK